MLSKKAKKLFRNPRLFFFDYFKHRVTEEEINSSLKRSNLQITAINNKGLVYKKPEKKNISIRTRNELSNMKEQKELVVDEITDINKLIIGFFEYLIKRTCFIQIVDTNNDNIFRIAVKSNDLNYVISVMKSYIYEKYVVEELESNNSDDSSDIRTFCFRDESTLFVSKFIEIDPWHLSEKYKRIYTNNYNPFCTHVDYKNMNKTVFASHPYFMQGDIKNLASYKMTSLMELPPSVYDNYDFDVDIVFTWVDGKDPEWLTKKKRYEYSLSGGNSENYSSARYEQIDELRYAMRSIAAYFKSFRKIFIVTDKQIPWWLDASHSKIEIIDHTEIFNDLNDLPVFNSHAIEANLHRIKDLSKKFVYMNDDIFIWKPINKSKFYTANGISISRVEDISNVHGEVEATQPAWQSAALNGNKILDKEFGIRAYSYHLHCPHALDKNVISEIWDLFPKDLEKVSKSKFRSQKDVSPLSFLYHAYSFVNGHSIKEDSTLYKSYILNSANIDHVKTLESISQENMSVDFVCLNDGGEGRFTDRVLKALSTKFPIKAEWEY